MTAALRRETDEFRLFPGVFLRLNVAALSCFLKEMSREAPSAVRRKEPHFGKEN